MQYRHAPAANFADLDAVLASAPGRPSLPVRLTLELFGRCRAHLADPGPVVVWDPCCGTGALLTTLGLLRGPEVAGLLGSDADPEPLRLAARNLALLDPGGLQARAAELDVLARRHGKPGYTDAAAAARRLAPGAAGTPHQVATADALDTAALAPLLTRHRPRIVLADVPYGRQTAWSGSREPAATGGMCGEPSAGRAEASPGGPDPHRAGPEAALVTALAEVLDPDAVIAVVARSRRVPAPAEGPVLERVRAGHRAAVLVRAGDHR